jgi:hypothetical protein
MFRTVFLIRRCTDSPGWWEGGKKRFYFSTFLSSTYTMGIGLMMFIWLFGCTSQAKKVRLPYYNTPDFTPHFIDNKEEVPGKITHAIAAFSFEDQDGKIIDNNTVRGRIHVANFMFTSCGSICPKMTNNLLPVSNAFSKDTNVVLLSYSVTLQGREQHSQRQLAFSYR